MRNRGFCPHLDAPLYYGFEQKSFFPVSKGIRLPAVQDSVRRHRHMLVNLCLGFILSWTIAAIFMINTRQGERSMEEMLARQAIIVALLLEEKLANR